MTKAVRTSELETPCLPTIEYCEEPSPRRPRVTRRRGRPLRAFTVRARRLGVRTGRFLYEHNLLCLFGCVLLSAGLPYLIGVLELNAEGTTSAGSGKSDAPAFQIAAPRSEEGADGEPAARDPARELVASVTGGNSPSRDEVAAGRFLSKFDEDLGILSEVLPDAMRLLRRGKNWFVAEAPLSTQGNRGASPGTEAGVDGGERKVLLRFVRAGGAWKIENVELSP